jgi:hypothetical protein
MVAQGVCHLLITGWLSRKHIGGWLAGSAWPPAGGLSDMGPAVGAFWLTFGSFALPQLLLGALIAKQGREGRTVPAYVGWGLAGWGVVCTALFEPSPFITVLIPAVMLLRANGGGRAAGEQLPAIPAEPLRHR